MRCVYAARSARRGRAAGRPGQPGGCDEREPGRCHHLVDREGAGESGPAYKPRDSSHLPPGNGRMPGGGRAKEEADRRGGRRGDTALTKQNKNQLRALQPTRVLYATPGRVRLRAPEGAQDMALYTAAAKYKAKKKLLGRRELRTQPCQQPLPQHALVSGAAHPTRVQAAHGTRGNALNH